MNLRSMRRVVIRGRQALRRGLSELARPGGGDEEAYARLVLAVLKERGPLPLGPLIEYVAQRAMSVERRGGSDIDIGLWGAQVYRAKIAHVVRRMVGRTLALEGDESSPALAPVTPETPIAPAA